MKECGVCSEEYEASGNMCPKMLPYSHTVCLRCLEQLVAGKTEVMCPECRQINGVPDDGPAGFVTNRYVLEFISYLEKSDAANLTAPEESTENLRKVYVCVKHNKECVMICFHPECWELLCPSCPLQMHTGHKLIGLNETVEECEELKRLQVALAGERRSLQLYDSQIINAQVMIKKESQSAVAAINNKVKMIQLEANQLKERIQQHSNEEIQKLDIAKHSIEQHLSANKLVEHQIAGFPEKTGLSECVETLFLLRQNVSTVTQSSASAVANPFFFVVMSFMDHKPNPGQQQSDKSNLLGSIATVTRCGLVSKS